MKQILAGLLTGLFILGFATKSEATLITQSFYVEINNVYVLPDFEEDQELAEETFYDIYGIDIGSKYFGTVTFDDTHISETGSYTIGHTDWSGGPGGDEVQDWFLSFSGPIGHSFEPVISPVMPLLSFENGSLTEIQYSWQPDLSYGPDYSTFTGDSYYACARFTYGGGGYVGQAYIEGTTYIPVPEPAAVLFLSLGFLGLLGASRKKVWM